MLSSFFEDLDRVVELTTLAGIRIQSRVDSIARVCGELTPGIVVDQSYLGRIYSGVVEK